MPAYQEEVDQTSEEMVAIFDGLGIDTITYDSEFKINVKKCISNFIDAKNNINCHSPETEKAGLFNLNFLFVILNIYR